jgi:hypothetical protein
MDMESAIRRLIPKKYFDYLLVFTA